MRGPFALPPAPIGHRRTAPELTFASRRCAGTSSVMTLTPTPMTASASFAARRWESLLRAAYASRLQKCRQSSFICYMYRVACGGAALGVGGWS